MVKQEITVILHNIRSSENVGSIFRTSDAVGVSKIYLVGYTPAPVDRFKRKNSKLAKSALGAEESIPWEAFSDIEPLITRLRKEKVYIVAVEQHASALPYTEANYPGSTAFIFGNEVEGVPETVSALCDAIVEVPMRGKKESLNVAVCAGVVLFATRAKQ